MIKKKKIIQIKSSNFRKVKPKIRINKKKFKRAKQAMNYSNEPSDTRKIKSDNKSQKKAKEKEKIRGKLKKGKIRSVNF